MEKLKSGEWEQIAHAATMDKRLTPNAYRLLNVLYMFTTNKDSDNGACFYSTDTLLKLCGFGSHSTLKKAQDCLVETGWVKVRKGGVYGGAKNTNSYRVNMTNEVPLEHRLDAFLQEGKPKREQPTEEKSEVTKRDTTPSKEESHKPVKSTGKSSDTGKGYSDKRKNYYKTLKSYAESLGIADAWRNEILEWVNRVLDQMPEVMDEMTPQDLFMKGTRKFERSELRWTFSDED